MINKYLKNGYITLMPSFSEEDIKILKTEIISLFDNEEQKILSVIDIKNKNEKIFKKIIRVINSPENQNFIEKLNKFYNKKISLLPNFHIMKNYHVNRLETHRIGWHRDCADEFNYEYSANKLSNENYVFGKIGIFFQNNSENYGGAVDVIPGSHLYIKKRSKFLKILNSLRLYLLILLHKNFINIYKIFPESFYTFFLSAKKIKAKIGSSVIFDSRIQHRGSPINEKYAHETKQLDDHHISVPKQFTKISIYCHFGSVDGADAYMYGRMKRKEESYKNYFNGWVNEAEEYKNYDKSLYDSMMSIIGPLKDKYKNNL